MSDFALDTLLVLIPALPLAAAILTAALGPKLLGSKSHWPTIAALAASFCFSAVLLWEVRHRAETRGREAIGWETTVDLWTWSAVADAYTVASEQAALPAGTYDLAIAVTLRADPLTAIMLVMVSFVSLLVAIYSAGYMHGDRSYWRFFALISLFVFSMTMLVSVSNFLLLYVFWEAVGVCSYLLIGFWYERPAAAAAGTKAFLVNRVGDFGFALALFLIWTTYGTLDFHDAGGMPGVLGQARLANADYVGGGIGLAIGLLLMLGACGKSAQFPLHVWLPDAMEGPTPVSALIHAATMVTAGIYMVTRCTPLFLVSPDAQLAVSAIGGFTALLAATIALTQNDLKRVLAYSTISQLGYMFLALGTGSRAGIVAGMFHLFTHAFFKALLFLGAGSVMHAMGGVIDVRRFGGLRRLMPVTHWTFLFGCLALAGVVPFAGFWSKDAILGAVHDRMHEERLYQGLYYVGLLTAMLTAVYTFRAFFLTFYGPERIPPEAGHHAEESPGSMTGPLVILAVGSLLVGFLHESFVDLISLAPSLAYGALAGPAYGAMHFEVALVTTLIAVVGIGLAGYLYLGDRREAEWLARIAGPLYVLSRGKFFFDQIYAVLVIYPVLALAWLFERLDRYLVDGLVDLAGKIPAALGAMLRSMQTGLVQYYAMLMVLGLLVLIGSLLL